MSLDELDDLDQFRLIVEQLEVCRDLVLPNVAHNSRMALILLDNAAEVILYRVSREALESDEFTRLIVPARFLLKQRNAMERFFEPKLDYVASKKDIDVSSVEMLRVLHHYRNAAVHRDTHNPTVIPILARLALLAVSDLFASTRGGVRPSMAGGYAEPIDWLAPYSLAGTFIDYDTAAKQIALQMKTSVEVPLPEARGELVDDLRERVRRVHQVLSSELPWGDDTCLIDDMLKWFEFRHQFPDLEYKLSERYRSLRYKIGEGSGDQVSRDQFLAAKEEFQAKYNAEFASYQAEFTCGRLTTLEESIDSVGRATAFNQLLAAYAQVDETVTLYERLVCLARDSYEAYVQMEIDISRGK